MAEGSLYKQRPLKSDVYAVGPGGMTAFFDNMELWEVEKNMGQKIVRWNTWLNTPVLYAVVAKPASGWTYFVYAK